MSINHWLKIETNDPTKPTLIVNLNNVTRVIKYNARELKVYYSGGDFDEFENADANALLELIEKAMRQDT